MYRQSPELPKVAYFCMEYGLQADVPIYSGGLGILAGDYIKAAKDLDRPMVAVGILWRQGYTCQHIGDDGLPYDVYCDYNDANLKDTGVLVSIRVLGEDVRCKVWLLDHCGNIPLYLLDAGYPGSPHAWMTSRLYGGGSKERIAAEMILGIGGVRALRALNQNIDVYHFNEGHAVFAGVELIRDKLTQGFSFESAWAAVRRRIVFTTHTPVAAGNEVHDHALLRTMGAYNGLNSEQMNALGGYPFSMTLAGLRLTHLANGVSKLHGRTTRLMWGSEQGVPAIFSVTNGIHPGTWQDPGIREAFETQADLRNAHMLNKRRLLSYIQRKGLANLREETLTIGFARRAASYKRGDLIFRSPEMIDALLRSGRLQLVFSGKAHPNDTIGKEVLARLASYQVKYPDSVAFIDNYNMEVAQLMVRGCDVWLNNPRRPLEASGTSGMKAAINGVLNLSVEDGWAGEGIQHGVNGWLLDVHPRANLTEQEQDERDLASLYKVLIEEVIPTYYDHPEQWLEMMIASIDTARWQFSSHRMVHEYYDLLYIPTWKIQNTVQN